MLTHPEPLGILTGLVELLGRLGSPLQPGGIEVAPFVLGFISTAAGASSRRRRRRRLGRQTGRRFGLAPVQSEQPRHGTERELKHSFCRFRGRITGLSPHLLHKRDTLRHTAHVQCVAKVQMKNGSGYWLSGSILCFNWL